MPATASQRELGDFLRSRRERLTPVEAGLPAGGRRRTPGLRREEVAEQAGISVDWYVRLEQGRAVTPSRTTVDALARVLRLGDAERAHLLALARLPPEPIVIQGHVTGALRQLLDGILQPAYVTNRCWDLLAWNKAAQALFGIDEAAPGQHNVLVYMLTQPRARVLFGEGWAGEARRLLALFRARFDLDPDNMAFAALAACLEASCPEFSAWWRLHDVGGAASGRKCMLDPVAGFVPFNYATFQVHDDPTLRLAIFSPASNTGSHPKI